MQDFINFLSHHQLVVGAILGLLVILMVIEVLRLKRMSVQINPQRATHLINRDNAVVIDIRDPQAFKLGHIIDAVSMQAEELRKPPKRFEKYRNKPLIIVCQTGTESQKIAAFLIKQGYNSYSLAGGLRAWSEAQLPLIKE